MPASTAQPTPGELFPFELVRPDLERVEISIREQVRAFDPAIEPYVAYVCNTSGKRIRPALAILVGGAAGGTTGASEALSRTAGSVLIMPRQFGPSSRIPAPRTTA